MNGDQPHHHGFVRDGPDYRVAYVFGNEQGERKVIGGIRDLIVLKTTQSGFVNFYRNEHTTLPDSEDRVLATNIAASWIYTNHIGVDFNSVVSKIKSVILNTFFGDAKAGVYSYSVQQTLHDVGVAVLKK